MIVGREELKPSVTGGDAGDPLLSLSPGYLQAANTNMNKTPSNPLLCVFCRPAGSRR